MDKIRYFFKQALRNIWANRMMSFASIGVLGICLILFGSSVLVSLNIRAIIREIDSRNQIMVFLDTNLDTTAINQIGNEIKAIPNVKQCTYISQEEAYELEKEKLGEYSDLLNGLDNQNFLPSSYQIVLNDISLYSDTVAQLKKIDGITDINQNAATVAKLNKINGVIEVVGIWLFAILAIVSLFIISNTIKLALYVRKREVNIMKFVGATDWFIRWPFIMEGCMIGIISGIIAFVFQWYIYEGLIAKAIEGLNIIKLVYYNHMFVYILVSFVFTGLVLGAAGSLLSVRKYLKV